MNSPRVVQRPYHHGDLRNALVQAGIELANEGGPPAIVLREAARRVGVSATAAYRHFATLPELVEAVSDEAMRGMGDAMQVELDRNATSGDARTDSWLYARAIGLGYVHYAIEHPGLFAVAFGRAKDEPPPAPTGPECADSELLPHQRLERALDAMVAAGAIDSVDREAASIAAWATVHGLSTLFVGKLSGVSAEDREVAIVQTLDLFGRGLTADRSAPSDRG